MKEILRRLMYALGIDITQNQKYDRYTDTILKRLLKADSNCLDVGCHKGEIMEKMLAYAPQGHHTGVEPIPAFIPGLHKKFSQYSNVTILDKALGEATAVQEFNWVRNAPAYSGLRQRKYNVKTPDIEIIRVDVVRLDDLDEALPRVDFMKIDVEGAEMQVLKGGATRIAKDRPVILFEFGLGASDYYQTGPDEMFRFFEGLQYAIYRLKDFVQHGKPYTLEGFTTAYQTNKEYYFIAHPLA